jgi:hypothetical protein
MQSGKGCIVEAPQGWSMQMHQSGIYSATFSGKPNSGIIDVPVRGFEFGGIHIQVPYRSRPIYFKKPNQCCLFVERYILWTHSTAINSLHYSGAWTYNYTADG